MSRKFKWQRRVIKVYDRLRSDITHEIFPIRLKRTQILARCMAETKELAHEVAVRYPEHAGDFRNMALVENIVAFNIFYSLTESEQVFIAMTFPVFYELTKLPWAMCREGRTLNEISIMRTRL